MSKHFNDEYPAHSGVGVSKEQTPIEVKAIDFCNKHAHKLNAVDSHNLKLMLIDFANSEVLEALEREREEMIAEALKPLYLMRKLRNNHGYFGGIDNGNVIEREIKALEEKLKQK